MNKGFLGIALAAHELWLGDDVRGNMFAAPYSDLRGSDLSGSDLRGSDLSGSNLRGSDLSGSDLRGSDLRGSDLSGSDLRGSDLRGSDLRGSDLRGSDRILGPQRSDGYLFTYCTKDIVVISGCRRLTFDQYRSHCETYSDDAKKRETLAILSCLELLVAARSESKE